MAIGRLLPTGTRGPAIRGSVVIYPWRGQLVARAWPKKRGKKLHRKVREQVEWFSEAVQLAKYADPESQRRAIEWSKGTGLYPRDLIVHAMAGNLLEFADENDNVYTKHKFATETVMFQGARIVRTATLSFTANVVKVIAWQSPILQSTSLWSLANPTRLTMPAGVTVASFSAGEQTSGSATGQAAIWLQHSTLGTLALNECETAGGDSLCVYSGPIPVVEGDYVEVNCVFGASRSILPNASTFFSCELLEVV